MSDQNLITMRCDRLLQSRSIVSACDILVRMRETFTMQGGWLVFIIGGYKSVIGFGFSSEERWLSGRKRRS